MTTIPLTPDRFTFRALVADVAARAKARLPEAVNGRVESAVKLVLLHDIDRQADGTIIVGSGSDPLKSYRLVGDTCECQDWRHGKAPQGWCQHRIAAGISKRVGELLAAQTPPPVDLPPDLEPWPDNDPEEAPAPMPPAAPLPEAPASANVRVQIAGREVQITLRDADETRLIERLTAVLQRFPVEGKPQRGAPPDGWCAVHQVQMPWNAGRNGKPGWHSHKVDGAWCKGKGVRR